MRGDGVVFRSVVREGSATFAVAVFCHTPPFRFIFPLFRLGTVMKSVSDADTVFPHGHRQVQAGPSSRGQDEVYGNGVIVVLGGSSP